MREVRSSPGFEDFLRAKARGGDATPVGGAHAKELAAIWAMLEKLAATDPAAYDAFIAKQKADAAADAAASERSSTVALTAFTSAWARIARVTPDDVIRPKGGAVNARLIVPPTLAAGDVLFLNLTSCALVAMPALARGGALTPADASLADLMGMTVDIAWSPLRLRADKAWIADIVLSPWVVTAAAREPRFREALLAFSASCVADELRLELERVRPTGEDYIGGTGPGGTTPQPYRKEWSLPPGGVPPAAPASLPAAQARGMPPTLASPRELLGAVKAADRSRAGEKDGEALEEALGGLAQLLSVGGSSSSANEAPPTGLSTELRAFAESFPLEGRVYSAAADVRVDVGEGGRAVVATLTLCPSAVLLPALRMVDAELDVEVDRLILRLPRRLLPAYTGLEEGGIVVALARLPLDVDPDGVRAKWSRASGTLTVTMPVA